MTPESARASSPRAPGGPARADDGRRRCSSGNRLGSRLGGARPPRGGAPSGGLRDRRRDDDRGGVAPGDPRWVGRRRQQGGGRRRRGGSGKRLRGSLLRGMPTKAVRLKPARQPDHIPAARQRATRRCGLGVRPLPAFHSRILPRPAALPEQSGPVRATGTVALPSCTPPPPKSAPAPKEAQILLGVLHNYKSTAFRAPRLEHDCVVRRRRHRRRSKRHSARSPA